MPPHAYIHTHTHSFNCPFSGTTRVSRYQKGKTNLDFTEARDSEWQWHMLGHMQVCTLLQTDNHANTPPLTFLQAGCPSCCPTNSVKALKALSTEGICLRKQEVGKPSLNAAQPYAKAEGCVHDDPPRADELRKGWSFRVGTWNVHLQVDQVY